VIHVCDGCSTLKESQGIPSQNAPSNRQVIIDVKYTEIVRPTNLESRGWPSNAELF
jgi:hypothetical protein